MFFYVASRENFSMKESLILSIYLRRVPIKRTVQCRWDYANESWVYIVGVGCCCCCWFVSWWCRMDSGKKQMEMKKFYKFIFLFSFYFLLWFVYFLLFFFVQHIYIGTFIFHNLAGILFVCIWILWDMIEHLQEKNIFWAFYIWFALYTIFPSTKILLLKIVFTFLFSSA